MTRRFAFVVLGSVWLNGCTERAPAESGGVPEDAVSDARPADSAPTDAVSEASAGDARYLVYLRDARPRSIIVDRGQLYWTSPTFAGDEVLTAPLDEPTNVQRFGPVGITLMIVKLAYDAQYLYWVNNSKLLKVRRTDQTVQEFAIPDNSGFGGSIASDTEHVYVVDVGCQHLSIMAKGGGLAQTYSLANTSVSGGETGLAVSEYYAYCASGTSGLVLRFDRRTETVATLSQTTADRMVSAVTVVGGDVYWADSSRDLSKSDQKLYRLAQGEASPQIVSEHVGNVTIMLLPDPALDRLYFLAGGRLSAFSLQDQKFLGNSFEPASSMTGSLALDQEFVYWGEWDGVRRVPKTAF